MIPESLKQSYEKALAEHGERVLTAPSPLSPSSYNVYISETLNTIKRLSRIIRTTVDPEFTPMPSQGGQLMSLRDFIYFVGSAFFQDHDGYGFYVRGEYISDIEIFAEDVTNGAVRTDFESIIWFSK